MHTPNSPPHRQIDLNQQVTSFAGQARRDLAVAGGAPFVRLHILR